MRYTNDSPATECALMSVSVTLDGKGLTPVQAVAVVNDWAVTPEWALRPVTERSRWVVTHIPTGLKTGVAMTRRQAECVAGAIRDIRVTNDSATSSADKLAIWLAHPATVRARWFPSWVPRPFAD